MSATQTRLPRSEAVALAWELVSLLSPYCERIEVAGSIRRGRPTVGDIELVCLPRFGDASRDLFQEVVEPGVNLLDLECDRLFVEGTLGKRYDKNGRPRWGSGLKWATYRDVPLDLFPVVGPTAQFGVDLLIRTGSADFAHRFVTPCERHAMTRAGRDLGQGWLPPGYHVDRGALWYDGEPVATPEERQVFEAIGREFVPPEEREVS
jgi:DNA polymerase/3'-5' exonuclease PolX